MSLEHEHTPSGLVPDAGSRIDDLFDGNSENGTASDSEPHTGLEESATRSEDDGIEDTEQDNTEEAQEPAPESSESIALRKMPKFKKTPVNIHSPDKDQTGEDSSTYDKDRSEAESNAEEAFRNIDDDNDDEVNDQEEQPTIDPKQAAIEELNRRIDAALKSGRSRRRKRVDEDDVAIDEVISDLRKRMRDAAYRDIDDNKDRLPAIHKVSMLPDVIEELRKTHIHDAFLDNNIVDSIRLWLEPLDDGSLPSLDIQDALLDILKKLPIRRDHLRESGIGKIVLFMSKCPRIPERNRRVCEQLVQQWSRMVLGLSSNFRDRRVKEASVNLDRRPFARSFQGSRAAAEPQQIPGGIQIQSGSGKDGERATARIPQRVSAGYNVMPVSLSVTGEQRTAGRDMPEKYKRLKQTMTKNGRRF